MKIAAFVLILAAFVLAVGPKSTARVNVNTAPADSLSAHLPGVGPAIAEKIVAERAAGKFSSVQDLQERVPGIGAAKAKKLATWAEF